MIAKTTIGQPGIGAGILLCLASCASLCCFVLPLTAGTVKWTARSGAWQDAASWGGSLPEPKGNAEVHGEGSVSLLEGKAVASRVDVGPSKGDNASLTLDGGSLFALDFLRMGEAPGSHGKVVLKSGRLCVTEIGLGGMNEGNGELPAADGALEIRGGSVMTRYLMLAWQMGSTGRLHIMGSKPESIVVLNELGLVLEAGKERGSTSELTFDLDAGGVTPIILPNKQAGVALSRKDRLGKCLLHINVLEPPPGGEIPLVQCLKKTAGIFHELPEGSVISASHGGKIYQWKLSYRGGASHCDISLTDPQVKDPGSPWVVYTPGSSARVVKVNPTEIKEAFDEMYHTMDEQAPPLASGPLAFPGAEGYGAHTLGGRGGKVLFVTNLNDAGPGSLREAVEAKGPRTVLFRVGGTIELKKPLDVREPYLTIAGQTAPGDGICLKGAADTLRFKNTHDIVIRYLRVRTGYTGEGDKHEGDCISCYSVDNFILDHCSTSWGMDETISCTENCDRYTVQWCILAEGLHYYGHSMGSILGGDRSTWHHNLYAHCGTRNPRFAGLCRPDFRNNVIYDWVSAAGYGDLRTLNYVGNYVKPGPSTTQKPPRFIQGESVPLPGAVFIEGNVLEGNAEATRDNRLGTGYEAEVFTDRVHSSASVKTQPAEAAFKTVLEQAGAIHPKRDPVDTRLVQEVRDGTGHVIRYEKEVGGYPLYAGGEAPPDADGDGIPDAWEQAHGLNPNDAADGPQVGADGYTNLERYLNSLVEAHVQ